MKNILATKGLRSRLPAINPTALVLAASMIGSALWTVQLSRIMGDFIEAEARAGRPPEETKQNVELYLKAVEASVEALGRDGRTVLVAEAVVSGSAPDLTETVRADVARRVAGVRHAQP